MRAIRSIFFMTTCLFLQYAIAQEDGSAQDHKAWAMQSEAAQDPQSAAIHYAHYLQKKKEDIKIVYRLAELKMQLGDYKAAESLFKKVNAKAQQKYPLATFYQAECLRSQGDCENAKPLYEQFRRAYHGKKEDAKFRRLAKNASEGCDISEQLLEKKDKVHVVIKKYHYTTLL